jgi:hypothetical protein
MQGKMGIETRNIIRDSKQYHIIKTYYSRVEYTIFYPFDKI